MKTVIQLDHDGYYSGTTIADESPLEPNVFLMPAGTIDASIPSILDGKRAKWNGDWVIEDIPQPELDPIPDAVELTYAEKRIQEYPNVFDYIDGIVKGDKNQVAAYIAACQAVKLKYPKTEGA
jgi:hypothetical protein